MLYKYIKHCYFYLHCPPFMAGHTCNAHGEKGPSMCVFLLNHGVFPILGSKGESVPQPSHFSLPACLLSHCELAVKRVLQAPPQLLCVCFYFYGLIRSLLRKLDWILPNFNVSLFLLWGKFIALPGITPLFTLLETLQCSKMGQNSYESSVVLHDCNICVY